MNAGRLSCRHDVSEQALFEIHFGEAPDPDSGQLLSHVDECAACAAFLAELQCLELAVGYGLDETPPALGMERVLARVDELDLGRAHRAASNQPYPLRSLLPSLAVIALGAVAAYKGGLLGAVSFFLAGTLITLAIAPVLILDSQRRAS